MLNHSGCNPTKLWNGYCKEHSEKRLREMKTESLADCKVACSLLAECHEYGYRSDSKNCKLYSKGCSRYNVLVEYEHFSIEHCKSKFNVFPILLFRIDKILYNFSCPSVGRSVGRWVGRSVRPSVTL